MDRAMYTISNYVENTVCQLQLLYKLHTVMGALKICLYI